MRASLTHLSLTLAALLRLSLTPTQTQAQPQPQPQPQAQAQAPTASPPAPQETFTAQARKLLSGPWTQLHLTQSLFSDDGTFYALALELKRDTPESTISLRPVSTTPQPFQPLTPAQSQALLAAAQTGTAEVDQEQTPGETFASLTTEEAAKRIRDGTLRLTYAVETFLIRSTTPDGTQFISNDGHPTTWDKHCTDQLHLKARAYTRHELKPALGPAAFKELEELEELEAPK